MKQEPLHIRTFLEEQENAPEVKMLTIKVYPLEEKAALELARLIETFLVKQMEGAYGQAIRIPPVVGPIQ